MPFDKANEKPNDWVSIEIKNNIFVWVCIHQPDVHLFTHKNFNQNKALPTTHTKKFDLFVGLYWIACIKNSYCETCIVLRIVLRPDNVCDNCYQRAHGILFAAFSGDSESIVNCTRSIGWEFNQQMAHNTNSQFVLMQRFFFVFVYVCLYLRAGISTSRLCTWMWLEVMQLRLLQLFSLFETHLMNVWSRTAFQHVIAPYLLIVLKQQ